MCGYLCVKEWSSNQLIFYFPLITTNTHKSEIVPRIYKCLPEASGSPALSYPCPIRLFEFGSAEAQPPPLGSKREKESSYQTGTGAELLNSVSSLSPSTTHLTAAKLQPPYVKMAMNQIKGHNIYVGGLVSLL